MVKKAKFKWFEKRCKSCVNPYDLLNKLREKDPKISSQFLDDQGFPINNPDQNTSYILSKFFPQETPDNRKYHEIIRKEAHQSIFDTEEIIEDISESESSNAVNNPPYGAPGIDNIPGFLYKILDSKF